MFILDEYRNIWNYTFVAVALFSIGIGTLLTIRKMKKEEEKKRREKRSEINNDNQE